MFCSQCGKENKQDAKFCAECGAKLELDQTLQENVSESQITDNPDSDIQVVEMKKRGVSIPLVIGIVAIIIAVIVTIVVVAISSNSDSDKSREKLELGRKYLLELNYKQAVLELEEAIKIDPKNVEAYLLLSEAYIKLGNYEKAIKVLKTGHNETHFDEIKKELDRVEKEYDEIKGKDLIETLTPSSVPEIKDETKISSTPIPTPTEAAVLEVPDVSGMTVEEAEKVLSDLGFVHNFRHLEEYNDEIPENVVLQTNPEAGTSISSTTSLDIIISKGPDPKNIKIEGEVGDIVKFGSYYQAGDGSREPIEWIILSKEDGKALLLSKNILRCWSYNAFYDPLYTTWEDCRIRKELNDGFYKTAFSEYEKEYILETEIVCDDNPVYGTDGGNSTRDNVFLLSIEEVTNNAYGFSSTYDESDTRKSSPTKLAEYEGDWAADWLSGSDAEDYLNNEFFTYDLEYFSDCASYWWLRTPGQSDWEAVVVDNNGKIIVEGREVVIGDDYYDSRYGVRPAIYVSLK